MKISQLNLSSISSPVIATFFSMLANGFLTTIVSIRLYEMGAGEWGVGVVSCGYYTGIVLGSFKCDSLINRIGHIRAYSAFASIAALTSLLCGILLDPYLWFILRLISGIAIAGIWISIESWLLAKSTSKVRGKYMSIYMISVYAASSLGQLFLSLTKEDYLFDFTIVAIFFAISIIPVCITSNIPPTNDKATIIKMKNFLQMNFAGIIGCFYAGITLATLYSILPLYFQLGGFSKDEIGVIMFAVIFGGMFFQLPIGYLSDLYNRKNMLIYLVITSILLAISMRYISSELKFYLPIAFVFGGVYFTVYPVSMSLVCDNIDKNQIVSVSQSLVLIYGIGNIIGPLIAPAFMIFLGSFGLFVFLITIGLLYLITLIIKNS